MLMSSELITLFSAFKPSQVGRSERKMPSLRKKGGYIILSYKLFLEGVRLGRPEIQQE
jgi:hypothetical protein